jgi:hypothetical protein
VRPHRIEEALGVTARSQRRIDNDSFHPPRLRDEKLDRLIQKDRDVRRTPVHVALLLREHPHRGERDSERRCEARHG